MVKKKVKLAILEKQKYMAAHLKRLTTLCGLLPCRSTRISVSPDSETGILLNSERYQNSSLVDETRNVNQEIPANAEKQVEEQSEDFMQID
ncbi:agamous MADS-box protein AGL80 [Trifolium repens]|nr:agamous MADS-box protein AGL80 [Trifolium repens]